MAVDNSEVIETPTSCIDEIFERLKLTHENDARLLPGIQRWIRRERPGFTPTNVFAVAVLVQRLARAFACRGTNSTAAHTKSTKTTSPSSSSTTMTASASKADNSASVNKPQTLPTPAGDKPKELPSSKDAQSHQGAPAESSPAPAAAGPPRKPKTPKKKTFRSLKKLDLSPKVVNSLRGFVADLASSVPLILRQVEYEQYRDEPHLAVMGRNPEPFTVAEVLDLALQMLEGDASTSRPIKDNNSKTKGNAAMEVFRHVVAEYTQNQRNEDGTYSSVMDELKFKTFCLKVLECALEHAIGTVESFCDYRRMYTALHSQHSVKFIPLEGAAVEQQLWIWKLAVYIVWKRQEEHPALCDRKERLLATSVSMVILATLPMLHRHPEPTTEKDKSGITNQNGTEGAAAGETPEPATEGVGTSAPAEVASAVMTDDAAKNKVVTSSAATDGTPNAAKSDDASSSQTTGDTSNKRSAPTEGEDSNAVKKQKISSEEGVSESSPGDNSEPNESSPSLPHTAKATTNGDGQSQPTTCRPQPKCSYCLKQEQTFQIITHVTKQSCAFLEWALKFDSNANSDISRAELDRTLNKVMKDLSRFSDVPPLDYKDIDDEESPFAWLEMLQHTIGLKVNTKMTVKVAEEQLFTILDRAFAFMQKGEEERKGTRVEAVSYIPESILAEEGVWEYLEYICPTISGRRKRTKQVAACIPVTVVSKAGDDKSPYSNGFAPMPGSEAMGGSLTQAQTDTQTVTDKATQKANQSEKLNPRLLMMGEAHNKLISNNRAVSPPLVTESMELNEWTIAILSSLTLLRPSPNLRKRLDSVSAKANGAPGNEPVTWASVVIPLLNRFIARMRHAAEGASTDPLPMMVDGEGEVKTARRTQDTQLWAAIIQFYYHSLECILYFESERLGTPSNPKLVLSESFHESLMACSYLCIIRAVQLTGKVQVLLPQNHQIYTILPITGCTPYTYLKLTESFLRALTTVIEGDETAKKLNEAFGTLPRTLQKEVKTSEVRVIESLVWVREADLGSNEGSIVNTIAELKQSEQWPPECLEPTLPEELEDLGDNAKEHKAKDPKSKDPDFVFVSFLVRKLLKISYFRIQAVCQILKIPTDYPLASQVWLAFRFLLRSHVELLYGRHIDQWILCTVYGICKVMKYEPDITFARIIDVYVAVRGNDLGVGTCQAIVRHVKILDGAGDESEADSSYRTTKMGDIIRLYNLVFVPVMKSYLLHSKSLRRNAAVLKKEIANKGRFRQSLSADNSPPRGRGRNNDGVSATVREGNVAMQVKLGDDGDSAASAAPTRTTTMMMIDQQHNDLTQEYIPGALPEDHPTQRTFLQFGRASGSKNISLANEMVAQAARS